MPRIPVRTEPYSSPARQNRHFKNKRDQILRALGKACFINGSHFAIMWVSARGDTEMYASDALQSSLGRWFNEDVVAEGKELVRKDREEKVAAGDVGTSVKKRKVDGPDDSGYAEMDDMDDGALSDSGNGDDPFATSQQLRRITSEDPFSQSPNSPHPFLPRHLAIAEDGPFSSPCKPTSDDASVTFASLEATVEFLEARFNDLHQNTCKIVAKAWIKVMEPKKQTKFPYTNAEEKKPEWWPEGARHKEPDHLTKPERISLLMAILRSPAVNVNRLELATAEIAAYLPAPKIAILRDIYKVAKELQKHISSSKATFSPIRVVLPSTFMNGGAPIAQRPYEETEPLRPHATSGSGSRKRPHSAVTHELDGDIDPTPIGLRTRRQRLQSEGQDSPYRPGSPAVIPSVLLQAPSMAPSVSAPEFSRYDHRFNAEMQATSPLPYDHHQQLSHDRAEPMYDHPIPSHISPSLSHLNSLDLAAPRSFQQYPSVQVMLADPDDNPADPDDNYNDPQNYNHMHIEMPTTDLQGLRRVDMQIHVPTADLQGLGHMDMQIHIPTTLSPYMHNVMPSSTASSPGLVHHLPIFGHSPSPDLHDAAPHYIPSPSPAFAHGDDSMPEQNEPQESFLLDPALRLEPSPMGPYIDMAKARATFEAEEASAAANEAPTIGAGATRAVSEGPCLRPRRSLGMSRLASMTNATAQANH